MPTHSQPNVLLIMNDQWRYNSLGLWDAAVLTPVVDKLAGDGAHLRTAYCSSPVCSPARASWLTGLYPHQHLQLFNYGPKSSGVWGRHLPAATPTLGDAFADAGYRCGIVGPWHLGEDESPQHGFQDYWMAYRYQKDPTTDPYLQYLSERGLLGAFHQDHKATAIKFSNAMHTGADPTAVCSIPTEHQRTTWTVDRCIEFLDSAGQRPWLLFCSIKDPHPPLVAPKEIVDRYDISALPLPPHWDDPLDGKPQFLAASYHYCARRFGPETMRRISAFYYALCSHIDGQVGRLLAALERSGQADHTVVVFISDHGESLGEHGLYAKRVMYEGSVRVPWIMRWPGQIPAGHTLDTPVGGVDLLPTLADLAGVPLPAAVHGRSVAAALLSGTEPEAAPVLSEICALESEEGTDWLAATVMVRDHHWKYIRHRFEECEELYDLADDPGEMHNLAKDRAQLDRLAALRATISSILKAHGPGPYVWAADG